MEASCGKVKLRERYGTVESAKGRMDVDTNTHKVEEKCGWELGEQ